MSSLSNIPNDGSHPCVRRDCKKIVPYDDEPFCFAHSPDSGSNIPGYSYARRHVNIPTQNSQN